MAISVNGTTIPQTFGNIVVNGTKVEKVIANNATVWTAPKVSPVSITDPTPAQIREYFNGFDDNVNDLYQESGKPTRFGASIWYAKSAPDLDNTVENLLSIKKAGYTKATVLFTYMEFFDGGCNGEMTITKQNGTTGPADFDYRIGKNSNFNYGSSVFYPNGATYTLPTRSASLRIWSRAWGYHPDNWKCTMYLYFKSFSLS